MGVAMKFVYAFIAHFVIYWVFVQPFIGKDFSYNNAISFSVAAIVLVAFSVLSNFWMIGALVFTDRTDRGLNFVLLNMALADLMQSSISTPLTLFQKITLILPNNDIGTIEVLIRKEKLIGMITLFAGILYASSIVQYCFLSFLNTWYRLQYATYRMTALSLQMTWLYASLCFVFDGRYWYGDEWKLYTTMYSSLVEVFVPMTLSTILIIGKTILERYRSRGTAVSESDQNNKLMYALVIVFVVFRAPLMVVNLFQRQDQYVQTYKVRKMKMVAWNLYHLKYCTNPLLVYILDRNAATMYGNLRERLTKCFSSLRGKGYKRNIDDYEETARVNYETSNQNVSIGTIIDEEAELLP